jgi:ABC-type transport system involved in multi-copper enzyme maturation permease subunit
VTGLIRVEILRLYSRRLVRVVVPLLLLLVVLIVAVDAFNTSKDSVEEYEAFRQERLEDYDRVAAQREADGEEMYYSRSEVANNPNDSCWDAETCSDLGPDEPYTLRTRLPDFGKAVAVICVLAAYLIGASAAGAEWSAGTMQSILFWESRRVRVVAAKVAGLLAVIAMVVIAAEVLFTLLAMLATQARGTSAGVTGGVWSSHLLLVLRGIGIASFAAILGFSIAFATRITAAAVGVGFIYFAVLEQLVLVWKMWLAPYLIAPLLAAWLNNGLDFDEEAGIKISGGRAGLTLAIYAAAMLTAATLWFRQRDVT